MRTPRTARRDKSGSYDEAVPDTGGGLASFHRPEPTGNRSDGNNGNNGISSTG